MSETIWSLVPPIITIILALATKEVYMSLIVGIFIGAFMFADFNFLGAIDTLFQIMADKVGGNVHILVFLVLLGIIVAAIARSGASRAYGQWAASIIKGKRSALFTTSILGIVIFIDDYFNCLTVGTVMRPVTDKFKITRAKLAYIIDATAAPICIIAPVSSWAAAVSSSLPEGSHIDGFALFLSTIPFNFYAWFTMLFMAYLIFSGKDFLAMAKYERENKGQIVIPKEYEDEKIEITGKGKILDLILPLLVLIGGSIFGMLYVGGIFEGLSIPEAFANTDAARGLVIGAFLSLIFTFLLYIPRGVLRFSQFCESFNQGFRAMTPAIFILCLAWTLSGVCGSDYLNIGGYVGGIVSNNLTVGMFMPAAFFVIAIILAFATGTSWGTFGILIPIAVAIMGHDTHLLVVTVSAILAGAVAGDHISPISDTTILASAGAQCSHIDHVSTQIPYALLVASASLVGYLVSGFTSNGFMGLITGLIVLALIMLYSYFFMGKEQKN